MNTPFATKHNHISLYDNNIQAYIFNIGSHLEAWPIFLIIY